jgi:uncharacterized membrane protein YoaK (UPF0700 family)
MPVNYARRLTGHRRTTVANRHLGFALAFVAGATNAGGFLAVHQYTSHMTGIVSAMADNLALGAFGFVSAGVGALLSFLMGAACTAVIVNYARRRQMHSEYALPLLFMLLCFIMGLQNALITKISRSEIRTTHITGIVTDIGIELGKLFYWNMSRTVERRKVEADRGRLKLLSLLVACFFLGGLVGAIGFKRIGYFSTVPLAFLLSLLAIVPPIDDVIVYFKKARG